MSAIKNWTYVAIASYWRKIDGDDWSTPDTYAEPVQFLCSYKRKSQVVRNSGGNEIVSTMEIKTEESQIVEGDLIALGEFNDGDLPPDSSLTVLAVGQSLDLFDQESDDYTVNC